MPELTTPVLSSIATTAAVAAGVAAGATAVTLAAWALARRLFRWAGAGPEERTARLVRELEQHIRQMRGELAAELERVREETRRTRTVGELAGSIDLDEVMRRTLDAAGALPAADAALVTVVGLDGEMHTASVGLSEEEVRELSLGGPPPGRRIRTMTLAFDPAPGEAPEESIQSGLAVPIQTELDTIGILSVFVRGDPRDFSADEIGDLEDLATRAGPAIENARRFREVRQLADLDALTGLHNRRYFHETLSREVARAQRYERRLALIVFDLDDFKAINDRIGHLAGDAVLARVAERVREVVRSADIPCRVGGDEFAIILPESTAEEADQLLERVQHSVSASPIPQAGVLTISAGIAELRPQDDATTFFQRADEALYRAKEGGKGRHVVAAGAVTPPQERLPLTRLQRQER